MNKKNIFSFEEELNILLNKYNYIPIDYIYYVMKAKQLELKSTYLMLLMNEQQQEVSPQEEVKE